MSPSFSENVLNRISIKLGHFHRAAMVGPCSEVLNRNIAYELDQIYSYYCYLFSNFEFVGVAVLLLYDNWVYISVFLLRPVLFWFHYLWV